LIISKNLGTVIKSICKAEIWNHISIGTNK